MGCINHRNFHIANPTSVRISFPKTVIKPAVKVKPEDKKPLAITPESKLVHTKTRKLNLAP